MKAAKDQSAVSLRQTEDLDLMQSWDAVNKNRIR